MAHTHDGAPVARHLIFVLQDGSFVVQWNPEHIQDIFTGKLRPFRDQDYGHAISDADLEVLREAGRVSHYDRSYIWLHALPEGERFSRYHVRQETTGRIRHFYLNTALPEQYLPQVQQSLRQLNLHTRYKAREHSGLVAVMNQDGFPFTTLSEAENAQNILRESGPEFLQDAAVAFLEFNTRSAPPGKDLDDVEVMDFDTLVASQTGSLANKRRVAVGIDRDQEFLKVAEATMVSLGIKFVAVDSGQKALRTIEDLEPDLVLMDLVLSDSHAWEILAKMKANQSLADIPVIIVSELGTQSDQVFALTVAKVHDYLVKPVSPGRLRQSVWAVLKDD